MQVSIQTTWSTPYLSGLTPVAVSDAECSRAGAGTGTGELVAEAAPEPRELGSLEGALGQQGRAREPGPGPCSLVGSPVGAFAQPYSCSKVPPQSWEGGKASPQPLTCTGGRSKSAHSTLVYWPKCQGIWLEAWQSQPAPPVLSSPAVCWCKGPRWAPRRAPAPCSPLPTLIHLQLLSFCFSAPSPLSGKRPLIASSCSPERTSPI